MLVAAKCGRHVSLRKKRSRLGQASTRPNNAKSKQCGRLYKQRVTKSLACARIGLMRTCSVSVCLWTAHGLFTWTRNG